MPKYGSNPKAGLDPRTCSVCGSSYQPYRMDQKSCSRKCYRRLPDVLAAEAAIKARPAVRERRNLLRRVETNPARRVVNMRQNVRRYGITYEQYEALLAAQDGRCVICGSPPDPQGAKAQSRLHIDHDRKTGRVRGLLCGRCNPGIGYLRHDPALLRTAIEYLAET